MNGILAKTLKPSIRRRRRCDKHYLELNGEPPDLVSNLDTFPVTPITPPAAFLPPGFKKFSARGEPY